ncbi:MAG: NAD-dependent epimerase/dehydratase family protein [Deltaproteobacteria bacterium]|nr:NAD-dependent epimerase/dehydratase family protein [Deltaproteobacteria bacterium]
MRIVVTGGAGFIGSHVVDAYIAQGHEVFVIDDLSTGERSQLNPNAVFHQRDILDPAAAELLARIAPDVLSLHAAQMDLRRSVAEPLFDARVNILGLIHLLEAVKDSKIRKVIFASSGGAVYGEQGTFPAAEDHPTWPLSPYGVSKLAGELYLAYYHKTFGIPYVALRYANVYGPRQRSDGEAGVVAIFIRHLLAGNAPIINGDGRQTRDYVYIKDVVTANLLALESSFTGALNIGTGRETDVLTLFRLLCEKSGSKVAERHGPPKAGEQRRSSLECARARDSLGWSARFSLSEGLEETSDYYRRSMRP